MGQMVSSLDGFLPQVIAILLWFCKQRYDVLNQLDQGNLWLAWDCFLPAPLRGVVTNVGPRAKFLMLSDCMLSHVIRTNVFTCHFKLSVIKKSWTNGFPCPWPRLQWCILRLLSQDPLADAALFCVVLAANATCQTSCWVTLSDCCCVGRS